MDGIFDEKKATAEAKAIFEHNYLMPLEVVKHKLRYTVKLRGMLPTSTVPVTSSTILYPDMHQEGTNCNELILRTAEALNARL